MNEILAKLNEEQLKPVLDTEGAVLVLAGAGSGKTRVLTSRIAHILDKRLCSPSNVLAITFTNKAAREMKERVSAFLGDIENMWICTIHSMCVRILRRYGEAAGIQPNFSIYSETERANVIKKIFKELDYDEKILKSVKYHIGNAKMLGLDPDLYAQRYKYEENIKPAVEVYERYNAQLKSNNALDFDDLLVETLRLLRGNAEVRDYLSDKFRYIHVDEFQDTNSVQYNIIKLLASKHGNLFAVGDDDQSIYGWRGAEIENILRFDKDYPQAKIYKLQRNYRSTKSILNLANVIIANNGKRHKKSLWTDAEEGVQPEYVQADEEKDEALFAAKTINAAVYAGGKYSDFAILMRINALTRAYEQEFAKYGIPYKVFGGFKFFERKEIKDVLAYMRLISNPFDDEAFTRIINVPRRGIGAKTLEVMSQYAQDEGLSLYDACIDVNRLSLPASAKSKIGDFANVLKNLVVSAQSMTVGDLVRDIIISTDLKSAYDDHTDEGDAKLANLDEFIAAVDDFVRLNPTATLNDYLNQVTLASDTDEMDDGEYVTLATIHSVKGLEFNNVIICGLEEGIMPTSRAKDDPAAIEEERRLMYVAITRARKLLWLTRSKSRYLYGHREATIPSPFVRELKGNFKAQEDESYARRPSSYGGYSGGYGGGYGARSTYNNYGSYGSRKSSYGGDGYEGDFWEGTSSRGRGLYSADDGYSPDPVPSYSQPKKAFSPASSFGTNKPAAAQKSGGKNYYVGCKVKHPKFGTGTVIALKNGGTVVDIAFENQGIKELSASIAPLEII
ncbi:MAG: UvrD-helicase domain-containing protein [Clostridia bacterium]|nr:UvrD-helicase domain-containing protein [Clostridia bacterium]